MRSPFLPLFAACLVCAQEAPAIAKVRVYPQQAWSTREARIPFSAPGRQKLHWKGLPSDLSLDKVQVTLRDHAGARLLGTSVLAGAEPAPTAEYLRLDNEARQLLLAQEALDRREKALKSTLELTRALKPSGERGGDQPPLDPHAVVDLERRLAQRAAALLSQLEACQAEQTLLKAKSEACEARQRALMASQKARTTELVLDVEATQAGTAVVDVEMLTQQARWRPIYDVRLQGSRVELSCYASLSQASGEPWKGVTLEISNAQPDRRATLPPAPRPVDLLYLAPALVLMGRVEGQLTDAQGQPVAGAQVSLVPEHATGLGTQTDARGAFRFSQVTPGTYRILARKYGQPETQVWVTVEAGHPLSLGLRMGQQQAQRPVSMSGATVEVIASSVSLDKTESRSAAMHASVEALENTPSHYEDSGELGGAWQLDGLRDVACDAKPRRLLLARTRVEAQLIYRALPRRSSEVFQVAYLKPAHGTPWFAGTTAALFREDERLGEVPLSPLGSQGAPFCFGTVPGLRTLRQRLEAKVAPSGEGRQWTLRERVILFNDLDREVDVEVEDAKPRSASDRVQVVQLPETTPVLEDAGGVLRYRVKVPARGQARIELGWRITGPATGSVNGLSALGLPVSD